MIQLNNDQKLQVLITELQERYNASHKIRERSTQFTLWISGMAIGLGWLLISRKNACAAPKDCVEPPDCRPLCRNPLFYNGTEEGLSEKPWGND